MARKAIELVKELYASLLDKRCHEDTNFFSAGGNSLLAIQLVQRIRRKFRLQIQLSAVYAAPTARELAAFIEKTLSDRKASLTREIL